MFGRNTALGIDIGDDAVRIVELQNSGEVTLAAFLPLGEGESGVEALAAFAREGRLRGRRIALSLPAADCAVKTATLPPAAPAELAQVIRFEAETQFPLPLPEMVWHYTLTTRPTENPHAVIVGARRQVVESRLTLAQDVGFMPALLQPAPLAAARAVAHPAGPHLLVMAGARWSDLCLFDGERLLACRSVLAGAPHAAEWAPRIMREARPWLMGSEHHPTTIVLIGGVTTEAAQALSQVSGLSVTPGNPWASVQDPHGFRNRLDDAPMAYATAIGLAQAAMSGGATLNLLPEQVAQARAQRHKLGWSLAGLLLIASALACLAWQGGQQLQTRQSARQVAETFAQHTRHALPPAPGGGLMTAQRVTDALGTPESRPLALLARLSDPKAGLPPAIMLTGFLYDRGKGVLTLKGNADSSATVATALSAIGKMPGVTRALLDATTTSHDGKGFDFQITCLLTATTDPTVSRPRSSGKGARP